MPAVARVGDAGQDGTYSGYIVSGSANVIADGIEVAFVGSTYYCSNPLHGYNEIVSSPVTDVIVNGNAIAVVGSTCACGATIIQGSPDVLAG